MMVRPVRAERYPLHLPVSYRPSGSSEWLDGTTENVSYSGVLFVARDELDVDAPVELRLALPIPVGDVNGEVFCKGRVVRRGGHAANGSPVLAVAIGAYRLTRAEA